MKVKVSKTMLKEILKYLKNKGDKYNGYGVYYTEMNENAYAYCVDYNGRYANEIDYDYNKGVMKVLKITYPYDYYACDKYLTTRDLTRVFKNSDKTLLGFMKELEKNRK